MSGILGISVTGLNAVAARIANAAENIVNASSTSSLPKNAGDAYTGYAPKDVISLSDSVAGNNLGVHTQSIARTPAYNATYDPNSAQANAQGLVATPNVDLAGEIVSSITAKVDYAANAAVIKIANKTEKALLDIKT